MADASLTISIKTDPAQPLELLVKQSKEAQKEVEGLGSSFARVGAAIAGLAALKGTFDFVLNATREMEDLTTQFISFTGSAEGATRQLQKLQQFAATSPFELAEVAKADRTLLAFGSTTSQSIEQLRQLGEVSAATGTDLSELATIFGQIQAEGKLTGERFNQLVERGVNIGPVLAESLGVAEGSLRKLREQGKITGDDVAKAFQKMTSEGGQFFGSTDRLSQTISGRLSTLKDSFTALAASIGNEASPVFGGYIDLISEGVTALNNYIAAQKQLEQGGAKAKRIEEIKDQLGELRDQLSETETKIKDGIPPIRLTIERDEILRQYKTLNDELVGLTDDRNKKIAEENAKFDAEEQKRIDAQKQRKKDDAAAILADEQKKEREKAAADELKSLQEKEKKITEIAFQEAAVRNEVLKEQQGAQDEEKIARLQEREAELTSERLKIEAERQDQLKQFDQAELLRDQDRINKKLAQEKAGNEKRKAETKKAQDEEFNRFVIDANAKKAFEEQTYAQRVATANKGLQALADLQRSKNREAFEIGKAAAIAQALVAIPITAIEAYKSLAGIPYVGPALGIAAAAAAVAAGTARVNEIRSQRFAFAEGGIVPGVGNKDTVPALLTPGEVVVPKSNFEDLQKSLQSGVTADQIVLLQQSNEIQQKILTELVFGAVSDKLTQIIAGVGRVTDKLDVIASQNTSVTLPATPAEEPQVEATPTYSRGGGEIGGTSRGQSGTSRAIDRQRRQDQPYR